jgi:hypothetical protein
MSKCERGVKKTYFSSLPEQHTFKIGIEDSRAEDRSAWVESIDWKKKEIMIKIDIYLALYLKWIWVLIWQ